MWLFTRYGFYSLACARKPDGRIDPALMMVRARLRRHLENLQARFPALATGKIVHLTGRDYRWRLFVPKGRWVEILAELGEEQEWSNFKDEAQRYQKSDGLDYVHALHSVWSTMNDLQARETPAY
jgi:hypothetical protein